MMDFGEKKFFQNCIPNTKTRLMTVFASGENFDYSNIQCFLRLDDSILRNKILIK